ncbi:hypothetical protein [Microtetraspora sp. NBRC 13810]|uniref:hypothetical protein n=1 Tax=Microtetraspora sp. NBRC 13810 TaxID=3030990 RepID=UPI0025565690|nr:hypothetical protein [Microtetraspora sp. NBRC 13810]
MAFVLGRDGSTGTTPVSAPTATLEGSQAPQENAPPVGGEPGEPGETTSPEESEEPPPEDEPSEEAEPSGEPSAAPGAAEQAQAVDDVLADSGGARSGLGPALDQVRGCAESQTGIATIERITEARREQVRQVEELQVDAVADGDAVRSRLADALGASLEADESFLTWARRQAQDCDADWNRDPDYRRGVDSSTRATEAKRAFVELWNPLARQHGLPERAEHEI